MSDRTCNQCGVPKPLEDFYLFRRTGRHVPTCKSCTCARVRANRSRRLEYYQQYDRLRFDVAGSRGEATKEARARASRSWLERNRDKKRAQGAAARAIRSGVLVRQPCEVCNVADDVEAHHEDYKKPLEVRWLCTKHHGETRRKERADGFEPVRSRRYGRAA